MSGGRRGLTKGWRGSVARDAPLLKNLLAVVHPLALLIMTELLPGILYWFCALEGHIGNHSLQSSLFLKLAVVVIIQTFFVSLIAGSILDDWQTFLESPWGSIQVSRWPSIRQEPAPPPLPRSAPDPSVAGHHCTQLPNSGHDLHESGVRESLPRADDGAAGMLAAVPRTAAPPLRAAADSRRAALLVAGVAAALRSGACGGGEACTPLRPSPSCGGTDAGARVCQPGMWFAWYFADVTLLFVVRAPFPAALASLAARL